MASGCKGCPLLGGAPCNANCAWYRPDDGHCAMWQIADKLTDLENVVNALDEIQTAQEEISKSIYSIWGDNGK